MQNLVKNSIHLPKFKPCSVNSSATVVHPARNLRLPTTDVYTEDDKQLTVEAHLPHFDEKDIDVHFDRGALTSFAPKHEQNRTRNGTSSVKGSSSFLSPHRTA